MEETLKSCNEFIKTRKDLEDLFEGYGFETYKWGKKGSKSVEDLFSEIKTGKSEILIRNEKEVIRKVRVVGINILYTLKTPDNSEMLLILKEVMRIKKDENGKFLTKNIIKRKHSSSIGKKLNLGEDMLAGATDSLHYKLSLNPINKFENQKIFIQENLSPSYPDFKTIYEANEFDLKLTSGQFMPAGYCYHRENDLTILEWRIV